MIQSICLLIYCLYNKTHRTASPTKANERHRNQHNVTILRRHFNVPYLGTVYNIRQTNDKNVCYTITCFLSCNLTFVASSQRFLCLCALRSSVRLSRLIVVVVVDTFNLAVPGNGMESGRLGTICATHNSITNYFGNVD